MKGLALTTPFTRWRPGRLFLQDLTRSRSVDYSDPFFQHWSVFAGKRAVVHRLRSRPIEIFPVLTRQQWSSHTYRGWSSFWLLIYMASGWIFVVIVPVFTVQLYSIIHWLNDLKHGIRWTKKMWWSLLVRIRITFILSLHEWWVRINILVFGEAFKLTPYFQPFF